MHIYCQDMLDDIIAYTSFVQTTDSIHSPVTFPTDLVYVTITHEMFLYNKLILNNNTKIDNLFSNEIYQKQNNITV